MVLHFEKLENPSPTNTLSQVWLKLVYSYSGKEDKDVKSLRRQRQRDNGHILIRKPHLSLRLR